MDIKKKIRRIPDFPEKGIVFWDIAPLLENKNGFKFIVDQFVEQFKGQKIDKVVGIDARGFIFAGAIAERLGAGMVMVRKKGKLPYKVKSVEIDIEYASRTLEIQVDSIRPGERVLLVDDVLATGGTMEAVASLAEKLGGKVAAVAFLIILDYLPGREKLKNYELFSLINYKDSNG